MTFDEIKKALECYAGKQGECERCPLQESKNCSIDIAREALKMLDQRQLTLKIAMMALDKGGYCVTVNSTGEIQIKPCETV